jgi:hypothetical protein
MSVPVVASSTNTAFAASVASVVITKPTGVALGDYLLAAIAYSDSGSSNSITPPAGWSSVNIADMSDSLRRLQVFAITATATEVAASNFTFTTAANCTLGGAMLRITDVARLHTSESDSYNSSSTTDIGFAVSLTPAYTDDLIVMVLSGWEATGASTISGYATTPSKTWTEVIDLSTTAGADPFLAIATAPAGVLTQITNYSATLSVAKSRHGGILLAITSPQNATGTNTLVTTTTTSFTNSGSAAALATSSLITSNTTVNTQTGRATAPTQWQNQSKPSTNWQNETL